MNGALAAVASGFGVIALIGFASLVALHLINNKLERVRRERDKPT
jgi:hypothetical protein